MGVGEANVLSERVVEMPVIGVINATLAGVRTTGVEVSWKPSSSDGLIEAGSVQQVSDDEAGELVLADPVRRARNTIQ
jgi:hypothetical protein